MDNINEIKIFPSKKLRRVFGSKSIKDIWKYIGCLNKIRDLEVLILMKIKLKKII